MQLGKGVRPKGIPASGQFEGFQLIRPFLCVSKQALISYAEENEVPYHQDPSNEEDTYTRNRFRKYVLPFFKSENPNFLEGVQRIAEIQRDEDLILDEVMEEKMRHFTQFYEQKVTFSIDGFLELPLPLQRRGFHLILNYLQVPIGKKIIFLIFWNGFKQKSRMLHILFKKIIAGLRAMDNVKYGRKQGSPLHFPKKSS